VLQAACLAALINVPAQAVSITRSMTGAWNLPDQAAHGMIITVGTNAHGERNMVVFLATYADDGQTAWFTAVGGVQGDTFNGSLSRVAGPTFLAPNDTPFTIEQVGTMSITFSDCNNGQANFITPNEVVGTGGFRIARISGLFNDNCSGGVSDDFPTSGAISAFTLFLNNTGVDPDASGRAEFEEQPGLTEFAVEVEDLDAGAYDLEVGGIVRAVIDVVPDQNGGTQGEVEFRSPAEPGKLLLDFDPRDQLIEIVQNGVVFLNGNAPAGSPPPPPPGAMPPPFGHSEIEVSLINDGVFPAASGKAELEQRPMRVDFKIELEDVPPGDYVLLVAGVERGVLNVVDTPSGPEGELEYRFPESPGKLLLDFDPLGQTIAIQDLAALQIMHVDFPTAGNGNGDDEGDDDEGDDDNGDDEGDDDNGDDGDDEGDDDNGGDGNGAPGGELTITVGLDNVGPDPDASGSAEFEQRPNRTDFNVEVEDLDDGMYELQVGGAAVAMIMVNDDEGEVEFRDPAEPGHMPLDFDPLGQQIDVVQNGTVFLSAVLPGN